MANTATISSATRDWRAIPTTPDYQKNIAKVKADQQPCAVCGRSVNTGKDNVKFIYTRYGSELCTKEEAADCGDAWSMPVGPDCWKNNPLLHRWQDTSRA